MIEHTLRTIVCFHPVTLTSVEVGDLHIQRVGMDTYTVDYIDNGKVMLSRKLDHLRTVQAVKDWYGHFERFERFERGTVRGTSQEVVQAV